MKTKELIEYLQGFDAESEVVVIAANPKGRKKYDGEMFGIERLMNWKAGRGAGKTKTRDTEQHETK